MWNKGKPPENEPLKCLCSDYMGEYEMVAMWIPYSHKGPKRQHGKGRWMTRMIGTPFENVPVPRKELPEAWRKLTREEFMEYHGLGEEDMRNDIDRPDY